MKVLGFQEQNSTKDVKDYKYKNQKFKANFNRFKIV